MAAADMALALMALDNEDAHWEIGHGDFGRFEAFELSDEERELLSGATVEVPRRDDKVPVHVAYRVGLPELQRHPIRGQTQANPCTLFPQPFPRDARA